MSAVGAEECQRRGRTKEWSQAPRASDHGSLAYGRKVARPGSSSGGTFHYNVGTQGQLSVRIARPYYSRTPQHEAVQSNVGRIGTSGVEVNQNVADHDEVFSHARRLFYGR